MKTLVWDLETAPNVGHMWGLWQQNIGLPQLLESGYVLCFAAKWVGEEKVHFHKGPGLVAAAHKLLTAADAIVTFNGVSFDQKWIQSEFVRAGLTPPPAAKQIDLCRVVKQQFRFPSNKLEYVASELLGEGKAATGGHHTWIGCMNGDPKAWARMREYNVADVLLTERLYHRLLPWIKNLPIPALYGDAQPGTVTCPQCGSNNVRKRGVAYTRLASYQRFLCSDCGRYSRGKHQLEGVNAR